MRFRQERRLRHCCPQLCCHVSGPSCCGRGLPSLPSPPNPPLPCPQSGHLCLLSSNSSRSTGSIPRLPGLSPRAVAETAPTWREPSTQPGSQSLILSQVLTTSCRVSTVIFHRWGWREDRDRSKPDALECAPSSSPFTLVMLPQVSTERYI